MRKHVVTVILLASSVGGAAFAQENGPAIIPEQLQQLALKFPISKRLSIDWNNAGPDDVGKYLGFLAATNEVAITVANSNNRKEPGEVDFLAALSIQCIWPNNKPPLVEASWPLQAPAFYNAAVREAIREAVGPAARELPDRIEELGSAAYASSGVDLPTNEAEYSKYIFDTDKLTGEK
ncbi:hypothetical protein CN221_37560 [Sinorhizobium meliloti]|uniref:hypothetical protein n=1 Tax=Rhizobium meliloti TaxID=382 RepID=UPI00035F6E98|nr:hypothetical protein [Sinorhizobium meliloti]MBP2465886.1 hypothetical protein [Sinorhizobium meliloti]MDE3768630.1 hypothetical protein [Sinorhizobium meliloti]MDE3781861.1 hypothetical protein [Sinorhizobium meliloti]MDE3806361.1 hypothetical protein [Sinorhizobium meliloti]MDE4556439.1 hypothetical protein [Sinorhizobium meliloti]